MLVPVRDTMTDRVRIAWIHTLRRENLPIFDPKQPQQRFSNRTGRSRAVHTTQTCNILHPGQPRRVFRRPGRPATRMYSLFPWPSPLSRPVQGGPSIDFQPPFHASPHVPCQPSQHAPRPTMRKTRGRAGGGGAPPASPPAAPPPPPAAATGSSHHSRPPPPPAPPAVTPCPPQRLLCGVTAEGAAPPTALPSPPSASGAAVAPAISTTTFSRRRTRPRPSHERGNPRRRGRRGGRRPHPQTERPWTWGSASKMKDEHAALRVSKRDGSGQRGTVACVGKNEEGQHCPDGSPEPVLVN